MQQFPAATQLEQITILHGQKQDVNNGWDKFLPHGGVVIFSYR